MKLSKAKLAILNTLASNEYDLSSREILEQITANGQLSTSLSSVYDYVEGLKKDGLIENGISEVVKGKTVLMWRITEAGRTVVKCDKDAESFEAEMIDEPTALLRSIDNLDEKISVLHKLLGVVPVEWEATLNSIIEDLRTP